MNAQSRQIYHTFEIRFLSIFLLSFDVVDATTAVVVVIAIAAVVVVVAVTAYHVLLTGIVRARYLCSLSK